MKRLAVLAFMLISVSAFADGIFKKADPKVMKQIQYRKVMAVSEMKILEKYIQCLSTADDLKKMNICTEIKEKALRDLRNDSKEIKKEVGQKTGS